jgi:hypothetical protein
MSGDKGDHMDMRVSQPGAGLIVPTTRYSRTSPLQQLDLPPSFWIVFTSFHRLTQSLTPPLALRSLESSAHPCSASVQPTWSLTDATVLAVTLSVFQTIHHARLKSGP